MTARSTPWSRYGEERARAVWPQLTRLEKVALGGQKLVYRAALDGAEIALKIAPHEPLAVPAEPDARPRAWSPYLATCAAREIEVLTASCDHRLAQLVEPGACCYRDGGPPAHLFAERWVAGPTLAARLRSGRLEPAEQLAFASAVSGALRSLHLRGWVHRDVKPANLLLARVGDVVLTDLGSAARVGTAGPPPLRSPKYCSPAQARAALQQSRADWRPESGGTEVVASESDDWFGLAVVLWEAATGAHPFWSKGDAAAEVLRRIVGHSPLELGTRTTFVPDAVAEPLRGFVRAALCEAPAARELLEHIGG